jgi:hypothetical protein
LEGKLQTVSTIEVMPDSSLSPSQIVEKRCISLIKALEQNYQKRYPDFNSKKLFKMELGRKYWKINQVDYDANGEEFSGGVHAFVDRNSGDVYKPASWKSPAKHIRYNLLDDNSFDNCISRADWAGGYLYIR